MATFGTRLYTWLRGEAIGRDGAGNRYYREKGGGNVHRDSLRRERRWVIYAGEVEASRVPPEWHAWLHHTVTAAPPSDGTPRRPWMKTHQPNQTGSDLAYRPPGHTLRGGQRDKATGDYEAWQPE
jgi:NADH:ubiquinone oxidoreductase subunit